MGKRKTCKKKCEKYPEYCFGEICFALLGIVCLIFGVVSDDVGVWVTFAFFGSGLFCFIIAELMGVNHRLSQLIK